MNRDNGLGTRSDRRLDGAGIHIEGVVRDVDEYRLQAEEGNYFDGGGKSEGHGDDLITRLELQCHQCHLEGIGPVGAGDDPLCIQIGSKIGRKLLHGRAIDIHTGGHHLSHRSINIVLDIVVTG